MKLKLGELTVTSHDGGAAVHEIFSIAVIRVPRIPTAHKLQPFAYVFETKIINDGVIRFIIPWYNMVESKVDHNQILTGGSVIVDGRLHQFKLTDLD